MIKKTCMPNFGTERIVHGFYTRVGGVSEGIYASLNCGVHSGDDPQHILENRLRVCRDMGGNYLSTLKQIHSPVCHIVEEGGVLPSLEGDALVTKTAGQVIGALAADCGPVLFYGVDAEHNPIIGAAHAGWGGALKGVLEATIARMEQVGAIKRSIEAVLGPCIGPESYEVTKGFDTPFIDEDAKAAIFFKPTASDKLLFDMPSYIHFRLKRAGLASINIISHDTYQMENDYFSFRRSTHRGEPDYGRQISAIMIRNS